MNAPDEEDDVQESGAQEGDEEEEDPELVFDVELATKFPNESDFENVRSAIHLRCKLYLCFLPWVSCIKL